MPAHKRTAAHTEAAAGAAIDYQTLFQDLPQPYIIFGADDPSFTILAENQAHADIAHGDPAAVVGRPVFDVFPDTSEKYRTTGVSDLLESFRSVIRSKKPDTMDSFRYDVKDGKGKFEKNFWRVTHYPLLGSKGNVGAICQATTNVTAEIVAGQQLKQTEDQLDEALSIGQVGSWVWDIATNRVIADRNLARLFGVKPERAAKGLPLKVFTDSIYSEDRPRVEQAIQKVLDQKGNFEEEYRTVSTDGTVRWVIARGQVEADAQGTAISFPGVIVDITDRKEAEAKLAAQLGLTNAITQSLGEGVFALDADGRATFVNTAAERILGWTAEELLGQPMHQKVHFQHGDGTPFPASQCPMLKVIKSGRSASRDTEFFTRKDGSIVPVSYTAVPLKRHGKTVGAVQSFSDITERKRTELNLRFLANASTELSSSLDYKKTLRAIARLGVPTFADWCAVDLLDADNWLQQVAIAHKDPKKVAWAKAERAKRPQHADDSSGGARVIRTGQPEHYPVITDEMLVASTDDPEQLQRLRNLQFRSVMIVPLELEQKPVGAISFVSTQQGRHYSKADFEMAKELGTRASLAMTNAQLYETARKELAERERLELELRQVNEELEQRVSSRTAELQAANAGLERSNRELQDFAYVASHDLQEPLRKIQAFSNLLSSEYAGQLSSGNGDGGDYLERMQNAASRMSTLIEDLLSFSRITTKARPFEEVDLMKVTSEVLNDLETRIEDTRGRIEYQDLPTITADPLQMRQLLQNLIGNALKFSKPGSDPVITIRADRDGDQWLLKVRDNGIGFDEKYTDRIFAVFQRLHGRESYQGTGIGLAICRKIAERHGGTITAYSRPNKGAEFVIALPLVPPTVE